MKNLSDKVDLPCGKSLQNRLVKSAMSENMADFGHLPGERFRNLYQRWAQGGVGLCITGNIMVDSRFLGEPNNLVLEKSTPLVQYREWTRAIKEYGMPLWVQLNHPGKQIPKFLSKRPVAPSHIPMDPYFQKMFNPPRELESHEILDIIERFSTAASMAKEAGFDGVQIHGAHGYLVSQFLSPKHNQRRDEWGGTLENRMRFLCEIYTAIRSKVGQDFPVGLKLNSSDFQKGGLTHEESIEVAATLSRLGVDLLEISGGTYEKPVMMGEVKESTKKREAYFIQYASAIKKVMKCPLVVTGGFRTQSAMNEAIQEEQTDLIGLARSLALDPDFPKKLLKKSNVASQVRPLSTGLKFLDQLFPLEIIWYSMQLHLMGRKREPNPRASVWSSILYTTKEVGLAALARVRA